MSTLPLALLLMLGSGQPMPAQYALQAARQVVIVRITAVPRPRRHATLRPSAIWRERRAAICQDAGEILRARFTQPGSVDLMMRDRTLIRARIDDDCNAGHYDAFYLSPGSDGRVCAHRDAIVSRAGAQCGINAFHRLEASARN